MSRGLELPALHDAASQLSNRFQFQFLLLVRAEYLCLFAGSVLAMDFGASAQYYLLYAAVFLGGLAFLLLRHNLRPQQHWYKARAVAESVKTSAWRFSMSSHPYNDDQAQSTFLKMLRELLSSNKILSEGNHTPSVDSDQVTQEMKNLRLLPQSSRLTYYLDNRVRDQRLWYIKKAKGNRRAYNLWLSISVLAYIIASGLALSRIAFPEWKLVPIEPVIVFASSLIGWVQIKKHAELAASYTLTATEIGMAAEEAKTISDESAFSDFVNDTELAFSREHTQWVARQQTAG